VLLHSQEAFGLIRTISPFRLTGTSRDYLIIGSDSGRVVILQFDADKNRFEKIHQETYGKTGCRRIVPGQYLAVDPKGRAFMIGAVEKQKFVYIMNRDTNNKLTISSPLEAHKSHTIIFDICGVDVGYENPLFAVLESDYGEVEEKDSPMVTGIAEKNLTFYEMDLGLNHVVRKNTTKVDPTANYIITVPGGKDGPGGVIICCEGFLTYESYPLGTSHKVKYPLRLTDKSGLKPLINCKFLSIRIQYYLKTKKL
jgi:splicing factor 3B subunit 3